MERNAGLLSGLYQRKDSSFRISLCFDSTKEAVEALGISIRLDSAGIHLVTGIAMKAFVPDKNAEKVWDRTMQHFLSEKEVDYEIE